MECSLPLVMFLAMVLTALAAADTFTSSANLRQLLEVEETVLKYMEAYVNSEYGRLHDISRLIQERRAVRRLYAEDLEDAAKYVGHPLNAYRLIQQQYAISRHVTDRSNEEELRRRLVNHARPFPEEGDYLGALGALLRLQRVYNITTADMRAGNVRGHQASQPLGTTDAFSLGVAARMTGDYDLSAQWLDAAVEMNLQGEMNPRDLAVESAETHYMLGDYNRATEIIAEVRQEDPSNATVSARYETYNRQNFSTRPEYLRTAATWKRVLPDWKTNYEALCRGDDINTDPKFVSQLYCQYRPSFIPYSPTKEELLSVDPRISLLYDVISNEEAEEMKNLATPSLMRSEVMDKEKPISDERISSVGWLWDTGAAPLIAKLSKRISYVTGLDTEYRPSLSSAEPFQVVNYGMGGQYEPHVDFYDDEEMMNRLPHFLMNTGDRIITFMYYLSQPEAGGATVFPKVKVHVPPVKNAAAFWYNIKKSGEKDQRTQHAGCPVLLGEKWVANKWIRERGQEFRRPCGLTYETPDDITS